MSLALTPPLVLPLLSLADLWLGVAPRARIPVPNDGRNGCPLGISESVQMKDG